jgi:hypothetical protein
MPLSRVVDEAPKTDQESRDELPLVMEEGFAVKELMTGGPLLSHVVPPGVIVYTVDPVA